MMSWWTLDVYSTIWDGVILTHTLTPSRIVSKNVKGIYIIFNVSGPFDTNRNISSSNQNYCGDSKIYYKVHLRIKNVLNHFLDLNSILVAKKPVSKRVNQYWTREIKKLHDPIWRARSNLKPKSFRNMKYFKEYRNTFSV